MTVTIEISDTEERHLREMAQRCGYVGIDQFVSDYIVALTRQDTGDDLAPMSEEEMRASLAMIERGMQDIAAGRYYTVEEARRLSLEKLREKQQ